MGDIYKKLNKAIAEQMGYEPGDGEYVQTMMEVCRHGASGGFGGFTYYTETSAFYNANEDDIWELLEQAAEGAGEKHPLALIATFQGAQDVHGDNQFKNLLAWFALEEVARWLEAKAEA
jgi:hypothetical protein